MKLTKLPNGSWIDPCNVEAIVPQHLDHHLGPHCAVIEHGQHHNVLFPTIEDAKRWGDEFADLVNGSEAPSSVSSGLVEGYPIEHDCWVVYEGGAYSSQTGKSAIFGTSVRSGTEPGMRQRCWRGFPGIPSKSLRTRFLRSFLRSSDGVL